MCMLCVIPPHTIPSRDKLENSALNNPHGFGFAIAVPEENRIIVERTMSADESINRFLETRAKYQTGYAIWHARIATSGAIDITNCHPFELPDEQYPNTTYVAHNGMLDVVQEKDDTRSDTRIFVEDLLPAIGGVEALDNAQIFNMIDAYTEGSKVAILTVHPHTQYEFYLFHEKAGKFDDTGVWWSNNSCELNTYTYASSPYSYHGYDYEYDKMYGKYVKETDNTYDKEYDLITCSGCWNKFDWHELEKEKCPKCKICFMCDQNEVGCMCYVPDAKYYATTRHDKETGKWVVDTHKYQAEGGWNLE